MLVNKDIDVRNVNVKQAMSKRNLWLY